MSNFNIKQIPSQKGKIAIVTGANIGLGYETALALAQKDIKVILACRNLQKAKNAKVQILQQVPQADIDILQIDLSKLASVRTFAKNYLAKYDQLDLLINNAGVMVPPFSLTEDGFELQMAANYFGHFLLTGLLLETIVKTPNSRIVSLSSIAHKNGKINFDDLQSEQKYNAMEAYSQSKLACLMFAYELQRRLEAARHRTISVAAHPGVSDTNLSQHIPKLLAKFMRFTLMPFVTHPPKKAAVPTLYAALGEAVKGSDYYGPTGFKEMKGEAGKAHSTRLSRNETIAKQLWEESERLVGLSYL